jgi:hypothetical protein
MKLNLIDIESSNGSSIAPSSTGSGTSFTFSDSNTSHYHSLPLSIDHRLNMANLRYINYDHYDKYLKHFFSLLTARFKVSVPLETLLHNEGRMHSESYMGFHLSLCLLELENREYMSVYLYNKSSVPCSVSQRAISLRFCYIFLYK